MKKELEFHAGALPTHTNPDEEAERLPLNYLQLVIQYKWRLLAGVIVGLVLGHLLYLKAGPEFEATTEIMVRRKNAPPSKEEERMLNSGGAPSEHIPLILSPMIAKQAVQIGNLDQLSTFEGEPDMAEVVLDKLKVKRVAGNDRSHSNVFDVRYTSKNTGDAKKVVEAVVTAYEDYLANSSSETSRDVLKLAKEATKSMKEELNRLDLEYSQFIQSVPVEFRAALVNRTQAQTQTNVSPQDVIRNYGDERTKNRIKMSDFRSRLQALESAIARGEKRSSLEHQVRRYMNSAESRGGESGNRAAEINIYQAQLLPLILKEKELNSEYGPNWPELVTVRRNIDLIVQKYRTLGIQLPEGLEQSIETRDTKPMTVDIVALYIAEVKQQLVELQIKEDELDRLIEEEQSRTKEFANYQAQEQHLRDALDLQRELWRKQSDREQAVGVEKDSNGYRMTRLSDVKTALVFKRMAKFYVAGAAMCVLLVAVTCVMRELVDLTIKTARDVRDIVRQPVLGSVCEFAIPMDSSGPISGVPHPSLRYLHAPSSPEAETYRTIRASLLVTTENVDAKLLMVTSPEPSDGKTTLISNLAVALAQSGKHVLLIDCDLRRPSIHQIFRVPQGIGLTEAILGQTSLSEVIRPTVVDRLSIITTGRPPSNPAETLSLPSLHGILATAREQYDFVLVDAPPLLAVSDPCVVARQTDGVLLVARLNKNPRSALIRVRQLLSDQGIPVIGAVINGVPQKGGHEYGYTYYGEYVSPSGNLQAASAGTAKATSV